MDIPPWALIAKMETGWEVIGLFTSEREVRAEAQAQVVNNVKEVVVFRKSVVFSRTFDTDEPKQG